MPAPPHPKQLAGLVGAYLHQFRQQQVPTSLVDTYLRELQDVPVDTLERAIREVIRTHDRFPTVAAIRAAAAEATLRLPTEGDALAQIERRIAWGRANENERGDRPEIHPLVRDALERVGGFHAFRNAESPEILRGQFGRLYRELRAGAIRTAQAGDLT